MGVCGSVLFLLSYAYCGFFRVGNPAGSGGSGREVGAVCEGKQEGQVCAVFGGAGEKGGRFFGAGVVWILGATWFAEFGKLCGGEGEEFGKN